MSHYQVARTLDKAWISVDLPEVSGTGGMVWVCEAPTGWHYPGDRVPLSKTAEVRLSAAGAPADKKGWKPGVLLAGGNTSNSLLSRMASRAKPPVPLCSQVLQSPSPGMLERIPAGKHSLHMRVAKNILEGQYSSFSHILVW